VSTNGIKAPYTLGGSAAFRFRARAGTRSCRRSQPTGRRLRPKRSRFWLPCSEVLSVRWWVGRRAETMLTDHVRKWIRMPLSGGNPKGSRGARVYSHSVWIVKAGCEDEFISRWLDLARWSALEGRASGQLLRDADRPERFVSLGPWESVEGIRRWRRLEGYHQRVVALQELVDSFEPHTLQEVATT
jgi:heme-degrading monooxygenase HmoA